jgi:hypothetical protein
MLPKTRYILALLLPVLALSCGRVPGNAEPSGEELRIYPDYQGVVIPPNLAPVNFRILNPGKKYVAELHSQDGGRIVIKSRDGRVIIPGKAWRKLLRKSMGEDVQLKVFAKGRDGWQALDGDPIRIAEEKIDAWIAFRKILPANILWKGMGIYQRSLETYEELPIMINTLTDENCMNCHMFNGGDPSQFMFHMRGPYGGTLVSSGGEVRFIDTKSEHTRAAGAYPSWHPSGDFIAYSVNKINQSFHARMGINVHVVDKYSDIVLYDLRDNSITRPEPLATDQLENLPIWSVDGSQLYFLSAEKNIDTLPYYDRIYKLMRADFDAENRSFSGLDTLIDWNPSGMSVSFPRERPGGSLVSFIRVDYGYFSIYNPEADVYFLDLESGEVRKPGINSGHTESYPTWSVNGSWLMFVSKRDDEVHSQPWFTYVDASGKCSKPFVLPQKDPDFYKEYMYNYNRPEFITGKVPLNPRKIFALVKEEAGSTGFNETGSVSITTGATAPMTEYVERQDGAIYDHE